MRNLAAYLERNRLEAREFGDIPLSSTDLVPHRLWPIAASRVLRTDTTLSFLLSLPGLILAGQFAAKLGILPGGFLYIVFLGIYIRALLRTSKAPWIDPARVSLESFIESCRSGAIFPSFLFGLCASLIVGYVFGVAVGHTLGVVVGVLSGVAVTAASSLTIGVAQSAIAFVKIGAVSPWESLRSDLLVSGMSASLIAPLLMALVLLLGYPRYFLALVAAYAALVGATVASAPWRRYLAMKMCSPGLLPFRLRAFTIRMYDGYIFRISGGAFQFSHIELKRMLAEAQNENPT